MNRRISCRTRSNTDALHQKVGLTTKHSSSLFTRYIQSSKKQALSPPSIRPQLNHDSLISPRSQRTRTSTRAIDSFSCGSTPHSSPKNEYSLGYGKYSDSKSTVSYDDSYKMDDALIEKMMEDQSAIMTANSVSPASPVLVPPGPPTSPVPSPGSFQQDEESSSNTNLANNLKSAKPMFRLRSRKRRNAICESNQLSSGLREFLVSYVVSNLSESMTNTLNLETSRMNGDNSECNNNHNKSSSEDITSASSDFDNTANLECPLNLSD